MIKPKKLKIGSKIGIIAPASPAYDKDSIERGVNILKEMGFDVVLGDSCFQRHGFLAGEDKIRVNDINKFFMDKSIDAIICLRGGYGTIRILDMIDYDVIRNNPKIFCGYSDITALHFAIFKNTKLVTFHGPMLASDISENDDFTIKKFIECVTGNIKGKAYSLNAINQKDVEGRILGGNLSLICSLLGTAYENLFKDKILFIEDIDEEPYKIDRMLYQLKLCGVFNKVKAVILGQFTNCEAEDKDKSLSFNQVIFDFFSKIQLPIYYDFLVGHEKRKITIPLNVKVRIENNKLYFMEDGVSNE
ncbi:LD-carboxypeptidase [Caloramator sp. E03]|uniref:S66 peptidase family protein n=1 Tax=Caloramator sp. E03 TaxID=2576307 RepID=UPI00111048EF|nr:LD-carboxypeptidase [Caloramator sp. E03]QCX32327.1 LD-carboxypeptidase [Caloramator sp. E03]